MELPIFCATALIGIRFAILFLSLILDTRTTYETLIGVSPVIYQDLSNVDMEQMLQKSKEWSTLSIMKSLRKYYLTAVFKNQFITVLSNIKTR